MKAGTIARAVLAGCLLLSNGPSAAQDGEDDWDFGADPARKLSIAAVTFPNFGVAVRCMDTNLSVVLSGLPLASGERTLRYRMGDDPETETRWISGSDSSSAFAIWPRSVATRLSRGGRLSITAQDGETARRFVVDLPASDSSISQVFRACGHDLEPPGQVSAPGGADFAGMVWVRSPEINFPDRARYGSGLAAILCYVRPDGGLRDCTAESEFPEGSGFGRAATLGAHQTAKVAASAGSIGSIADRRITFVTRYSLDGGPGLTPAPSRLPAGNGD